MRGCRLWVVQPQGIHLLHDLILVLLILNDVKIGIESVGTDASLLAGSFFNLPHPLL